MRVLGIDPGASGGWALLDRGKLHNWGRMPTVKLRSKTIVDGAALFGAIPCELELCQTKGPALVSLSATIQAQRQQWR